MAKKLRVVYYHDGMVRDLLAKSVEVSGDMARAYRTCNIEISNTIDGRNHIIPFKNGGEIRAYFGQSEFFRGILFDHELSLDGSQTLTVHDSNVYLVKNSDSVRFEGMTATQIISSLCNKYGVEVGTLADTRYVIPRLIERGKTLYEIIKSALNETQKATGRRYRTRNIGGKLELIEIGAQDQRLVLENRRNILDASFSESIEDTRTRVKLTGGDEDKPVTVEVSSSNVAEYGIMQHYEHNSDVNTAEQLRPLANALLAELDEPKRRYTITAIGDIDVISATTVTVSEEMTNIKGAFFVEADTHRFEANGLHTMDLMLTQMKE